MIYYRSESTIDITSPLSRLSLKITRRNCWASHKFEGRRGSSAISYSTAYRQLLSCRCRITAVVVPVLGLLYFHYTVPLSTMIPNNFRLLLWIAALAFAVVVRAEDSVDENGYYHNKFSVCDNSYVVVEEITLLCDSPGTYYYGSNKYRNSASCQGGDKAKLEVLFKIQEDLTDVYENVYLDVSVSGYGSVQGMELYTAQSLCSTDSVKGMYGEKCPSRGYYKLYYVFHYGDQSDSYSYAFVPKVTVGFYSNPNKNQYDLGGANTNACSGGTFTNWTKGVRKSAANTIKTFLATFGILLCAVLAVFVAGWLIMRQARNQPKEVIIEDPLDDNEKHKVALVGNNKTSLLDVVP